MFFQCVPDPVIGPGLGKMITAAARGSLFSFNYGLKYLAGPINDVRLGKPVFYHNYAGAMGQNICPF